MVTTLSSNAVNICSELSCVGCRLPQGELIDGNAREIKAMYRRSCIIKTRCGALHYLLVRIQESARQGRK